MVKVYIFLGKNLSHSNGIHALLPYLIMLILPFAMIGNIVSTVCV